MLLLYIFLDILKQQKHTRIHNIFSLIEPIRKVNLIQIFERTLNLFFLYIVTNTE